MNGLRAGKLACGEYRAYIEVAVFGRRGAYADGLVGDFGMQRAAVGLGIDRDRAYSELPAGPYYSYRYLAAVGYEDFIYHCFLTSCVPQLISPGR
jgi:hypothetical protein